MPERSQEKRFQNVWQCHYKKCNMESGEEDRIKWVVFRETNWSRGRQKRLSAKEIVILSEVSQTEKDKYLNDIAYM